MRLRFDPERPIYQQIIEEFKRAIARGELAPGDRIPSQRDLAMEARINPNTVQRAYREMEWLGLTETLRGQGTFVARAPELLRDLREDMAREALDRFVAEMAELGFTAQAIAIMARDAAQEYVASSETGTVTGSTAAERVGEDAGNGKVYDDDRIDQSDGITGE